MYTHTIYKIIIMKQLWERKMIYNHEVNITDGIKKNTLVNFNRHDKKVQMYILHQVCFLHKNLQM